MKNKVQQFGKFLSGMVMPNIGALIAFGFLAALFIDTGWIPNEKLNSMVSPMLTYLIPILIASTGGKMVGGDRGRVVGAIAAAGAAGFGGSIVGRIKRIEVFAVQLLLCITEHFTKAGRSKQSSPKKSAGALSLKSSR